MGKHRGGKMGDCLSEKKGRFSDGVSTGARKSFWVREQVAIWVVSGDQRGVGSDQNK